MNSSYHGAILRGLGIGRAGERIIWPQEPGCVTPRPRDRRQVAVAPTPLVCISVKCQGWTLWSLRPLPAAAVASSWCFSDLATLESQPLDVRVSLSETDLNRGSWGLAIRGFQRSPGASTLQPQWGTLHYTVASRTTICTPTTWDSAKARLLMPHVWGRA